jgi:hypothetical protein
MAQAVSRWPFTSEIRVCCQISQWGNCGEQSGIRTGFIRVFGFTPSVSFHRGYIHLSSVDDQLARWWPQLRDIVSPHRSEHPEQERWVFTYGNSYTIQSRLSEAMWTEATSDNTEGLFGVRK